MKLTPIKRSFAAFNGMLGKELDAIQKFRNSSGLSKQSYIKKKRLFHFMEQKLSAIISKDGKYYVARSVEIELASQGKTAQETLKNLKEAFELWLEHAEPEERKTLSRVGKPSLSQVAAAV